jgi:hypothetical protein
VRLCREEAVIRGVLALSVGIFSLFHFGASARAEELKFQCVDSGGGFPVTIDTKTKSVLLGEPNLEQGRASISGSSISITLDNDPNYHALLNRRTGALSTSEGNGKCTPVK